MSTTTLLEWDDESQKDLAHSRADARLARRAIKNRWPVPRELREQIIQEAKGLIDTGDPKYVVAGIKTVIEADKINIAASKLDQPTPQQQVNVGVAVNANGVTAAQVAAELIMSEQGRKLLSDDQ